MMSLSMMRRAAFPLVAMLAACGGAAPRAEETSDEATSGSEAGENKAPAPKVKRAAADAFAEAAKEYARGPQRDWGRIEAALKDAIDEDSKFAEAYFNLGVAAESRGKLDEARDWYSKAREKNPAFGDGLVNMAAMQADAGSKGEADSLYQQAIQAEPLNGYAHLNLAMVAKSRKDFVDAVKRVRTALKEDSQNIHAYVILAWTYYDMGKFELAKLVCSQALSVKETEPAVHNIQGLVHLKLQDVTRALASFQRAVELDNNYVPALFNIGAITFSYKDYEASYRAFDQVVKLEPKNAEAGLSRAVAARGMGNYEEAERGYKAVIGLDERYAAAHFNLGVLYQEFTQKPDEAIKAFEGVLRVEQNDAALRKDATERIKQVQIQLQTQREAEAMMKQQAEEDRKRAAEAPPPAPESAPAEPAPPAEAPTP